MNVYVLNTVASHFPKHYSIDNIMENYEFTTVQTVLVRIVSPLVVSYQTFIVYHTTWLTILQIFDANNPVT